MKRQRPHNPRGSTARWTSMLGLLTFLPCSVLLVGLSCERASALDTLFKTGGEKQVGTVMVVEEDTIRIRVPLPALPGSGPEAQPVFATVVIPRKDILHIEFNPDEAREALLKDPKPENLPAIETLWRQWQPFLTMPRSPAGRVAIAYADLLLKQQSQPEALQALELFTRIEHDAWDEPSQMQARQGRLRAMVATGQAEKAVNEAIELSKITEDPAVLIEAKYILARAADQRLRDLVEDNPRWEEDIYVIPERHRLYNEALDEYFYPYLFLGAEQDAASRGLWGAVEIYRFTGELPLALECARDLAAIYPETSYARQATDFIESLPQEIRDLDPEKEARENLTPETQETHEKKS